MDLIPAELTNWGIPLLATLGIAALAYWLLGKTFANQPSKRLYRQLAYVALAAVTLIVLMIALPLGDSREEVVTLFSVGLTAVVALASTSFVSNAMAGLMLKAMGTFHTGDFIRVDGHFGRVTAKALLHTEIQSEDRDTIALPNFLLITNPVQVVDQSGTLISAELSIGYETHRRRVRDLLISAAEAAGLTDAFVQVTDISDFAVRYKVTGFLEDIRKIVSMRSELKASVLDTLHQANIEVMTPSVMSQRPLDRAERLIPEREETPEAISDAGQAERLMFDKAELAARIERFREQCETLTQEIKALRDDDAEKNKLEIDWREHQVAALIDIIEKSDGADG